MEPHDWFGADQNTGTEKASGATTTGDTREKRTDGSFLSLRYEQRCDGTGIRN